MQALDLEVLKDDGKRQFGKLERLCFGLRQPALGGHRQADEIDQVGAQRLDLEPAAQKRRPVPVDAGILDAQPHALAVGHRDLADGRFGRQDALDAADPDLAVFRRELVLDEIGEVGAFFFRRILRERRQGEKECQQGYDETGQNACPIPT